MLDCSAAITNDFILKSAIRKHGKNVQITYLNVNETQ